MEDWIRLQANDLKAYISAKQVGRGNAEIILTFIQAGIPTAMLLRMQAPSIQTPLEYGADFQTYFANVHRYNLKELLG